MPIPKPNKDEKQNKFVKRCMSNELMKREYPKAKLLQRFAICMTQWRRKKETEEAEIMEINKMSVTVDKRILRKYKRWLRLRESEENGGVFTMKLGKVAKMLKELKVKEAEASNKPWASVNKSKLPRCAFLWVEDPKKKTTWHLPYKEGAGGINPKTGMYKKCGPVNLGAVRAIMAAIGGARVGKGKKKTKWPANIIAKANALAKRYKIGKYRERFKHGNTIFTEKFVSLRSLLSNAVKDKWGGKYSLDDFSRTEVVLADWGEPSRDDTTYYRTSYKITRGNVELGTTLDKVERITTFEQSLEDYVNLIALEKELTEKQ